MTSPTLIRARKRADLLSITGATVAGTAIGAGWGTALAGIAPLLLVLGLVVHAVGMTSRHRLDTREGGALPVFWRALYLLCWAAIALAAVAAVLLVAGGR